jgi:hypothetical protein
MPHKANKNYNPNGERRAEGGRQTALLPQKTRKIYSYNQVKKALSEGFRNPAAVPVSRFQFFAKKDGKERPVGAFAGSDPRTIKFYLELAQKHNWAVLYQGTILITKKKAEKLRENRRIAKGDIEKLVQLDQSVLFGEEVVRLAYRVLIDIDKKDEVAIRKLVKYLRKLKIYPEVWETKDGYHLYVYFYDRKEEIIVIDEDGKQKVFVGFILPRADDNRIKDVEECLKVLCAKLNIETDIVSATHAVWLEGFPNPLKDGFATKLLFKGFPLPLQDVWQKLLNVNPAKVFKKVRQNKIRYYRKRKPKKQDKDKEEEAHRELDDLLLREHSNVFFALSQHGTLKACKKLLDAGYELDDIKFELERRLNIRTSSDEEVLQEFLAYFEKNYTTHTRKQESPPKEDEHKEEERKHEHYWELALRVIEAWEKGYQKISHIAKYLRVPRTNIYNLRSFLKKHGYEWEDLFTKSEEVLAFLKAHAKGGNKWKRKKEWDREAWLEEFQRLKPEYIRLRKEEAKARRAKKRLAPVLFLPAGSVYIGNIQVYSFPLVVGWSTRTNRPPRTSKKKTNPSRARRNKLFTPAVPLVILSKHYSTQLRDALYEVLQRYHSEDGLPVVLVVPSRFSDTGSTSLKLTPYKVPPRNFRQLWQEIKEKFGKTIQGLSTKNGAVDWFLRAWERFKEEIMSRGWVSVGSSPFPSKEGQFFSSLSTKLSTCQEEPSNKLTKTERSEKAHPDKTEPTHQMLDKTFGKEVKPMQEQITAFTSFTSSNGCGDPKTALPVPVDGEPLGSSTSVSEQDTLTSTPSSSGQLAEEFEKETEEPAELVMSEEGLREEEQKRIPSEMTWEDLLQALVDGELSEEEFGRILFETEKKKGITLRGVFSAIRKLLEKAEKAQNCLREGKLQEAEKLLESINRDLQDLEEKTRNALEKRGGLKHPRKKLIAILMKLNDFSLKQLGVHFIYRREEIGKFIKLLDEALERYLIESGYDLEKDFQTIVKAFLETYAFAFLRWAPTREMFFKKFIKYRWAMKFEGGPTYFKDTTGRTYSIAEIIRWVDNYLEQTTSVPGFPPSQVVQTVVKFFEGKAKGSDVVKVSGEELATAIYTAWKNADPEKANLVAVSEYIDKYEGVLWRKLNNGHYVLLVSSDETETRIRDYVLGLKQAKKNGQGQTSADGNGSLGFQSSNGNNGNGKYDIDQIIHTLQKEGKVYVPQQFLHEIVRELRRRGFSVNYWTTTGLIELAGGDDELPF